MQRLYVLSLVYSITLAFIYIACQFNRGFMLAFSNVSLLATAGAAVTMSFWILDRYADHNPKPMFAMAWVGLASGISLWFLSTLAWTINVPVLQINPYFSLADILHLSGYFPLFLAGFLILKLFKSVFSKKMLTLQFGVAVGLSAVVSYVLVLPMFYSGKDPLTTALSAAFPIFDLGLFTATFAIFLIFFEGALGKAWFFLTVGILMSSAADLLFTYAWMQDFYYRGHPLELFWLWGCVTFLLGIYIHKREL